MPGERTMIVREYTKNDLNEMTEIWNEIVIEGNAFPQEIPLNYETGAEFFAGQTYVGVAEDAGAIVGLYILHPNNVGRCGHISNASYAVKSSSRGQGVGEKLVRDCLVQAKNHGFGVLQFNAVVESNVAARRLYEKLGFIQLGTIKSGFRLPNGTFTNICPYYIEL